MSKMNKPRLGRGLSSLISVSEDPGDLTAAPSLLEEPPSAELNSAGSLPITQRVIEVPVEEVRSNPNQPRRQFDEAKLAELSASIKTNGVIQPIVLRKMGDGYELIAGERRLRATKLAGLATIPAIIKEIDGLTQAQWALVENIQREDLNAIDRALAYQTLIQQLSLSHAELANRLGEDRSTITNHLRLLELAIPVRALLQAGKLSLGHAKVLAGVADVLEQESLALAVVKDELSVRALEALLQTKKTSTPEKPAQSRSAHIKGLERSISQQLGMKVTVKSKPNGKGSLVIRYSSLDQFDELLGKLKVQIREDE